MTRSMASARRAPKMTKGTRCKRDPSITLLGFTCYRLVAVEEPEPGESPWWPVELMQTRNTMGAFMSLRAARRAS